MCRLDRICARHFLAPVAVPQIPVVPPHAHFVDVVIKSMVPSSVRTGVVPFGHHTNLRRSGLSHDRRLCPLRPQLLHWTMIQSSGMVEDERKKSEVFFVQPSTVYAPVDALAPQDPGSSPCLPTRRFGEPVWRGRGWEWGRGQLWGWKVE